MKQPLLCSFLHWKSGQASVPVSFQSSTVVPLPRRSTVTYLIDHNTVAVTLWGAVPPSDGHLPSAVALPHRHIGLALAHLSHRAQELSDVTEDSLELLQRCSWVSSQLYPSLVATPLLRSRKLAWRSPAQHSHHHRTSTTTETQEKLTTKTV